MLMSTNAIATPQATLGQLNWRYATKQFDPTKQIPVETWQVLEPTFR
jgi:hypothetical protein